MKSRSFGNSENPGQQKDSQKYVLEIVGEKERYVFKVVKLVKSEKFVKKILKLRGGCDTNRNFVKLLDLLTVPTCLRFDSSSSMEKLTTECLSIWRIKLINADRWMPCRLS